MRRKAEIIIFIMFGLFLASCGVVEKTEKAVIEGYVYRDSLLTQPLPDVFVRIRIDGAQNVPDVFTTTDESGYFKKAFYLGHTLEETGFKPITTALVKVKLTYEGKIYNYEDYYISPGDTLKLPPVYLDLFGEE